MPTSTVSARLGTRYAFGLLLILLVACIWVGASELIQVIFTTQNFDKPFFLTYFNTGIFTFWLSGFLFRPSWRKMALDSWRGKDSAPPPSPTKSSDQEMEFVSFQAENNTTSSSTSTQQPPTLKQVVKAAAFFCLIWMAANYTFNLSLGLTSVASNTILSTTSSLFTFLIGWLFLKERFELLKLFAVTMTLGGAVLVATMDQKDSATIDCDDTGESAVCTDSESQNTIQGDALALLSAVLYASYVTLLRKKIPNEDAFPMTMFFGFVGLINLCALWPILAVLHFTGLEEFQLPPGHTILYLFVNGFIGTNLSDVLWAKSVLLTSPLVATIGLSLTIPLAMIFDALIKGKHFPTGYICGALLVIGGFLLINTTKHLKDMVVRLCGNSPHVHSHDNDDDEHEEHTVNRPYDSWAPTQKEASTSGGDEAGGLPEENP